MSFIRHVRVKGRTACVVGSRSLRAQGKGRTVCVVGSRSFDHGCVKSAAKILPGAHVKS